MPRRSNDSLPAEVRFHVSEPQIVLFGFGGAPFVPLQECECPACGGHVEDRPDYLRRDKPTVVYCARCDGMSDRSEDRLARQRFEAELTETGRTRTRAEDGKLEKTIRRSQRVVLSEAHRREIWLGYKGSPLSKLEPTNLAKAGREFLAAIGQLPDWSLKLDARGKVIGRWGEDE